MGIRIVRNPAIAALGGEGFETFVGLEGEVVAAARSSRTVRGTIAGVDLHVKQHVYTARRSLAGALRNTFRRPSRAAREYRMLLAFAEREAAPRAAAVGEKRRFGFLRHAFVASVTVPGGTPLSGHVPDAPDSARVLGDFLGSLHRDGFSHGRLYARNLLALPDRTFRLVDLDRARAGRRASVSARTADLACLGASLERTVPPRRRLRFLAAYRRATGCERGKMRRLLAAVWKRLPAERARLERRLSRAGRTSPSSSGARPC